MKSEDPLFLFEPLFFKVIIFLAGILLAIFGLTFLVLRRRSEILDHYFTPNEADLEEDFFRRRAQRQNTAPSQQSQEETPQDFPPSEEWGDVPNLP